MTLTIQNITNARVSTRPCIRKKVSTMWIDRATDPPMRTILLKTKATAALKDFNAVAPLRLTIPSTKCSASPLIWVGARVQSSTKNPSQMEGV